jgi:cytochrome c oxidase subunit 2
MRLRHVAPALLVGALVLSACGGGDDDSSDGTTPPSDADVVVRAVDPLSWDKDEYSAAAGEVTIEVSNDSSQPHDLRVVDPSGTQLPLDLNIPSKGDVEQGTLTLTAGAYTLICTIPGHANMKSTLTVS